MCTSALRSDKDSGYVCTKDNIFINFYQCFIYSPTDALLCCLKNAILKFALKFTSKQLRHVSVLQLHHHQGTH